MTAQTTPFQVLLRAEPVDHDGQTCTEAGAGGSGAGEAGRLFALGTRSLADLIAPSGCEIRADHLQLDGQYGRVLVVTAYPRRVTPGWLSHLVEIDVPIEVKLRARALGELDELPWRVEAGCRPRRQRARQRRQLHSTQRLG